MKRRLLLTVLLTALLTPVFAQADTRIMVASDPHFLSPLLYDGSELFLQAIRYGDGKMAHYSAELLQALVAEARHQRPDALILSGDLTFNGEKQSHLDMAAALAALWDEGIPVYVIPGNHDINNPSARFYDHYAYRETENVSPEEFGTIWQRFMNPAEAPGSFTYTLKLNDKVWLAMLDVSVYRDSYAAHGLFTEAHKAWLAGVLSEAKAAGARVITVTHQSLLEQAAFSPETFCIEGRERMAAMLRAGGVTLNLSGHIHVQHTARSEGLTDVAIGAFSVSPHLYSLVTVQDSGVIAVDVRPVCAAHLPEGFGAMSSRFFGEATAIKLNSALQALPVTDEERREMLAYAMRFNARYFAGILKPEDPYWRTSRGYRLWLTHKDEISFSGYMLGTLAYEEALASGR